MNQVKEQKQNIKVKENQSDILLLVSTSKGGFIYYSNPERLVWEINGPHLLGSIIHHMVLDHRTSKTILMAAKTKEYGVTIFRTTNFGKTWVPASIPPENDSINFAHIFRISPGHHSELGVWYAGTSPQGLFRSEDDGKTWLSVDGFNNNKMISKLIQNPSKELLKYQKLHSILINPNNKNHIIVGMAHGGVFESKDYGESWSCLNFNLSNLDSQNPYGLFNHPTDFNFLFQQNQSGIYSMELGDDKWGHIGKSLDMGDKGFSLCLDPYDIKKIWTFPMEGTDIWSRICSNGQPAVYCTQNSGKSWYRQDIGFPIWNAWFTVLSRCMVTDNLKNTGLYLGTTSGSVWFSGNSGNSWRQILAHLPKIYSLEIGYINH